MNDDIRAFKKYFYSLSEYPDDYIITIDDDIMYPSFLISELVKYSSKYPKSIICQRARKITYEGKMIKPYMDWIGCKGEAGPSYNLFITSGGGTLFPPNSLHSDALNKTLFKSLSMNSDDMWLSCMAQLKNTSVVKTDYYEVIFPVMNFHDKHLSDININDNKNDKQFEAIRSYYIENLGIDPYSKVFY